MASTLVLPKVDLAFERDPRRQQELRMRPVADSIYRSIFGEAATILRTERKDEYILDRQFAIDLQITLPSGLILLGQEKCLSYSYAKYRSVTVEYYQNAQTKEPGDWFKIAVQVYFVGYCALDSTGLYPWILLDWPQVVWYTHRGMIKWQDNKNKDGSARASFRWYPMDEFPSTCVIARYKSAGES